MSLEMVDMIIHSSKELALFMSHHRKKKKLTQKEAGSFVGLKQATLSHFENKPGTTRLDTLFRLLSVLGLELDIREKGEKHDTKAEWIEEW